MDTTKRDELKAAYDAVRNRRMDHEKKHRERRDALVAEVEKTLQTEFQGQWEPIVHAEFAAEKAVIQVYRDGDPLPENNKYNIPLPGSVVLRFLTKTGKPGKRVEQWRSDWMKEMWLAEGQAHPNQKAWKETPA